jgi:hypothetical protein
MQRTEETALPLGDIGMSHPDSYVVKTVRALINDVPSSVNSNFQVGPSGSIEDYLSRPFLINSGSFATTDGAGTFPNTSISDVLYLNTALTQKVQGKFLAKFDIKLKLVVNADRFQQGRYILAGIPTGGNHYNVIPFINSHRHTLVQITQLPHVEIDLSTDSEVEIILPWVGPHLGLTIASWNNHDTVGNPWVYFLYPYSPLVSVAGSNTASYSLFASLVNVKFGAPAQPQMGRVDTKTRKKNDPIAEEQSSVDVGPISNFLSKISGSMTTLATIPLLSGVATTTSWGTDILSKVANVWGWSSPSNLGPAKRIYNDPFNYMANGDGVNNAMPMSLTSRNHVDVCPGFARTDADEMSINFIKAIPAYWQGKGWITTDEADDILFSLDLAPATYSNNSTETITLTNYTPLGWLCKFFRMWRGSIVFNFKFVKTDFHSGRLLVVFNPVAIHSTVTTADVSNEKSNYCYREIIDIREKNEFQFIVPYVNVFPWQYMSWGSIGTLQVSVLDPLICPATVATTVPILIEVCGGPDFEVAIPVAAVSTLVPTYIYTPQMGDPNVIVDGVIGGASIGGDDLFPTESCVGEKINSLRTLAKRYSRVGSSGAEKGLRQFRPFAYEIAYNSDADTYTPPSAIPDMLTHLSLPYLLSRGGVRLKTLVDGTSATAVRGVATLELLDGAMPTAVVSDYTIAAHTRHTVSNLAPVQEFRTDLSGAIDMQVPMYHHTYARNISSEIVVPLAISTFANYADCSHIIANIIYETNPAGGLASYRAAADDYNLGFFISILPYSDMTYEPE